MKEEYIKPEPRTVRIELENGAVICASGDLFWGNPGIVGREIEVDWQPPQLLPGNLSEFL